MSEPNKCPYCGATIIISGLIADQQARMMTCPNCGASIRHVPGFGVLADTSRPSGGRPPEISTQPTTRTPSTWSSGPAISVPQTQPMYQTPQKEFDQSQECIKGCGIICGLCLIAIFIIFLIMLRMRMYY